MISKPFNTLSHCEDSPHDFSENSFLESSDGFLSVAFKQIREKQAEDLLEHESDLSNDSPNWRERSPVELLADMTLRGANFFRKQEIEPDTPASPSMCQSQQAVEIQVPVLPSKSKTFEESLRSTLCDEIQSEAPFHLVTLPSAFDQLGSVHQYDPLKVEPSPLIADDFIQIQQKFDNINLVQSPSDSGTGPEAAEPLYSSKLVTSQQTESQAAAVQEISSQNAPEASAGPNQARSSHSSQESSSEGSLSKRAYKKPSLGQDKQFSVDKFKKHIIRGFREYLKLQFDEIHQKRQYHWVPSSKRAAVRSFFVDRYKVPSAVYKQYESDFFRLILNTERDFAKYGIRKSQCGLGDVMEKVFGQQPSLKNMKQFFSNEVIQGLWANQWDGQVVPFKHCEWLKAAMRGLKEVEKQMIHKHFEKVEATGFDIL